MIAKLKWIMLGLGMMCLMPIMAQETNREPEAENSTLTPEERATKRTDKMKQELNLTEAQVSQVYTINLEHILIMDQYREEQKALREKMKAEREATRAKIKGVLTPEQNVIFDQKAEEHKKQQEEKRKNGKQE